MEVHRLDWIEALPAAERPAIMREDIIAGRGADTGGPSALPNGDKFPAIIGSDLIYEVNLSFCISAAGKLACQGWSV